ncbi:MAG: hypothetical protein QOC73_604 [Actinomycetota bacterium]|nr:hypothetical protein [Actinomycetota bacterium]
MTMVLPHLCVKVWPTCPSNAAVDRGFARTGRWHRNGLRSHTWATYIDAMRGRPASNAPTVSVDDVRAAVADLPRSYEVLVHDRVKFRVGRIVYLAFSRDEAVMGFAFPKEERAELVAAEPAKFAMPAASDLRYNWVHVRLDAIDVEEMRELVVDAWRMVVPKRVAREHLGD